MSSEKVFSLLAPLETLDMNIPPVSDPLIYKVERSGSMSSIRSGAGIFVKPHPKLRDLPSTAISDAFPSTGHEPKPLRIVKRSRTRSTDTICTSPSSKDVVSLVNTISDVSEKTLVPIGSSDESTASHAPTSLSSLELDSQPANSTSDTHAHGDPEALPKTKKWKLFARSVSLKKIKNNEDKEESSSSAPATPLTESANISAPPKPATEARSEASKSAPSSPQMLRRSSSSSNVLRKAPPPHLQLNMKSTHRPDVHPSQLHLSSADLSKVNAYFAASMSDTTLSVHSSHSTLGKNSPLATPRSPGGTVIPPNLFAPGHLVDRGQLLEQIQRKRAAMDSGADVVDPMLRVLRLEHKRPLSLVPELVEGLEEEAQDLEVISVDDALAIMYPDLDVAVHEFEQEMTETPDLYFVIDPGWEISLGSEVTCCFIDDPFPQDVPVARYADAFTHFSDRSENDDYGVPFDISESTEE